MAGLALWLALCGTARGADVRLAVAANFTDTGNELIAAFAEATGRQASASYGSTGKLYAQIRHGAPFDVFMAADRRRPELLEDNGLGVKGTRFTYARGQLVLWSPQSGLLEAPETWLASKDFTRLAIANPKTAPYGMAAREVLIRLDLWAPLQQRLVRGDSIAQTFQFVATANAQAGFVALSQIRAWNENEGSLWRIPSAYYSPINQQAILLTRGERNPAARQWLEFLRSETARSIIERYGYDTRN
ncbi:molybdate ABC transporter substrate-binding protein [Marinobacter sp. M216]|uniref:Molybdate ABC transporter substrate-binding protein n=1 Tax=Marinobacter albus TaxID=3030833 RepID=A0ABT7H8V4_9GAMM|nr:MULTISPECIES: molybdate ABC transporter substrate-binding protein [unclassified Marinobacter]MDK9556372.1 molybdate ABC transporter substrate-binding protein [Marinobacter sp. M216]